MLGILWMAAAALCFAMSFSLVKHLSAAFSTFEIVFIRQLLGFFVMLPWLARMGISAARTMRFRLHLQRAALGYGGMLMGYWSLALIPISDSIALQFTLPMWTAILAMLFLGETVGAHRWFAIAIGLAGVLVIIRPGFAAINAGMVFALSAALCYAGTDTTARALSSTDSIPAIMFYGYLLQLPIAAVPAFFDWVAPSWADAPAILAFAATATVAQYCLTKSLGLADASLVSPVLFLRLPFAALLAWIWFGEPTDTWTWIGAGTIFAGTYVLAHREARAARRAAG